MNSVKRLILDKLSEGVLSKQEAMEVFKAVSDSDTSRPKQVAIIGIAARLPMSPDVDCYWDNLVNNRNCFVAKPPEKLIEDRVFENPSYAEFYDRALHTPEMEELERYVGPYLNDADKFDAGFFGISDAEADTMDPQHRIFLEQAWRALEDAGYSENIRGTKVGCFVGRDGTNSNFYRHMVGPESSYHGGIWEGIVASRINYHFDLRGPSAVVDTACSSSLVAMQMGINAIANGDCTMALAGGVALTCGAADTEELAIEDMMVRDAKPGTVVAGDNRVRSFDAKASGAVFGEGVSVVVLKALDAAERDGDHIYGVVAAVATNSDGASNGLTAPNPRAQGDLMVDAWKKAGIDGADVEYVETHGTGTPLGDPIEVLGLTNAFSRITDRKQFCGIGSVKSNIGHTVGAAGVAGVIKVLLCMKNELIPASLNFEEPNPHIDFANSPVYVVDRNTAWPRRDTPRYGGVSSFGFSGTNAHVLLRDYQGPKRPQPSATGARIFTVSAKTEAAFNGYLASYDTWLNSHPEATLEDVSFTSTCGRGHYEHRLAIVATSFDDLIGKFNSLRDSGWVENPGRGIYLASHRVVSDRKQELAKEDIRDSDLEALNRSSAQSVTELQDATGLATTTLVRDIARNYVRGAAINFEAMAQATDRRISLPTYPFEKKHHWGVPRRTEVKADRSGSGVPVDGALITESVVESGDLSVYQARLSIESHWAVRDHIVLGQPFIAGTVHLELMTEALALRYGTHKLEFHEVLFLNPATAQPHEDLLLQVIIKETDGVANVEVVGRIDGDEPGWTLHVRASASPHDDADDTAHPTIDEVSSDPDLTPFSSAVLTEFGPTWHNLREFWSRTSNPEIAYGILDLPEEFRHDLPNYPLHPALMDNAVSMMPFMLYMKPNVYLPMVYRGLKIHRPLPARFYSRTERIPSRGRDLMSFQTTLVSPDGATIATIDQFSMKRVSQLNDFVSGSYYALDWRETAESSAPPADAETGTVLLVGDDTPLVSAIEAAAGDRQVRRISFGATAQVLNEAHLQVEPTRESVLRALDHFAISELDRIIDVSSAAPERQECTDEDLDRTLNVGVHGFAALVTAALERLRGQARVVVVADHAASVNGSEPFVDAANAAKLSMVKSLRHECPSLAFSAIDIDAVTPLADVAAECLSVLESQHAIALRAGDRLEPVLVEQSVDRFPLQNLELNPDGFYLITGGLGSLGSAMASGLSRSGDDPVTIVLASRRNLPPRSEWRAIMDAEPDSKLGHILDHITDAEDRGCTVEIAPVDLNDRDKLSEMLTVMRSMYGPLRGIVHAAGLPGDGFLYGKSAEEFDKVLAPKVAGLRHLVSCIEGNELDFLVCFSSMTALIGGPGQSDYAAANSFLDAYVVQLRKEGINAKSINWPGWRQIGMAHDAGLGDLPSFFDSLSTSSGIAAFNELLIRDTTGMVPGKLNVEVVAAAGEKFLPFNLTKSLSRAVRRALAKGVAETPEARAGKATQSIDSISLSGKPMEEFTELEKAVAYTYAVVLGLEEVDIFDSFTSMGGNSIAATELMRALNATFGDVLNIADMFSYGTPEEMASRIAELTVPTNTVAASEAEVESNLDDMLHRLESGEASADDLRSFLQA